MKDGHSNPSGHLVRHDLVMTRHSWRAVAPALLVPILAACSSVPEPAPTITVTETVTATAIVTIAASPTPTTTGVLPSAIPSPDASESVTLGTRLAQIAPEFGAQELDKIVSRARNMCSSVLEHAAGVGGATPLAELAQERFDPVPLTDEQAQRVVDVITTSSWCTAS